MSGALRGSSYYLRSAHTADHKCVFTTAKLRASKRAYYVRMVLIEIDEVLNISIRIWEELRSQWIKLFLRREIIISTFSLGKKIYIVRHFVLRDFMWKASLLLHLNPLNSRESTKCNYRVIRRTIGARRCVLQIGSQPVSLLGKSYYLNETR